MAGVKKGNMFAAFEDDDDEDTQQTTGQKKPQPKQV
jgi:hypothetical protein